MTATMTATVNFLKSLLLIGAYLALMSLVIWNFPAITAATRALLERAGSLTTLEVAGVKIGFDPASVAAQLDFPHLTMADKDHVQAQVKSLEPDEFERLMNVGELKDLCDFEKPTVDMRRMIALDYQLNDKGLVALKDSPELLGRVEAAIAAAEKSGKPSAIGHPRACYRLELTDLGRNAKTALVRLFSAAFTQHVAMK